MHKSSPKKETQFNQLCSMHFTEGHNCTCLCLTQRQNESKQRQKRLKLCYMYWQFSEFNHKVKTMNLIWAQWPEWAQWYKWTALEDGTVSYWLLQLTYGFNTSQEEPQHLRKSCADAPQGAAAGLREKCLCWIKTGAGKCRCEKKKENRHSH